MPGRAINNNFLKSLSESSAKIKKCYNCITTCNPASTPYCISRALINSARGDVDNGLLFCGSNTYKIKEIVPVKELLDELTN